ncbi:MAG: hypothetical protein AB7F75_01325 [Planctomycetota bacterium]
MKTKPYDKKLLSSISKVHTDIAGMTKLIGEWARKHCDENSSWAMFGDLNGVREDLLNTLVRITYDGNSEETTRAKILEILGK